MAFHGLPSQQLYRVQSFCSGAMGPLRLGPEYLAPSAQRCSTSWYINTVLQLHLHSIQWHGKFQKGLDT